MADNPSLADLATINGAGARPDAAYPQAIHLRSAYEESVLATAPMPMVPVYGEPLSRPVQRPTGEAPLQQMRGGYAGLSISNSNAFGTVLNRAGSSNQYFDQNGESYTQAGPHGVVNNRTGGFSPTN